MPSIVNSNNSIVNSGGVAVVDGFGSTDIKKASSINNATQLNDRLLIVEGTAGARLSIFFTAIEGQTVFQLPNQAQYSNQTEFIVNGQALYYGTDFYVNTPNNTQIIYSNVDWNLKSGDIIKITYYKIV